MSAKHRRACSTAIASALQNSKNPQSRRQKLQQESVMKCANPDCNRGIGLVSHQRGWFDKRRYCSRQCRNACVAGRQKRSEQERIATTYFELLFLHKPQPAWLTVRRIYDVK
jgi:hypothetical protein